MVTMPFESHPAESDPARARRQGRSVAPPVPGDSLPPALRREIERAGYYPALVGDVVGAALAGDLVQAHLVHQETTFDEETLLRHITVLVLTDSRLIVVHADDHDEPQAGTTAPVATATSETVPLSGLRGVMVTHVVPQPNSYRPGTLGRDVTITIGWGAVARLDVVPATCGDPTCDGDHGYEGTVASDDISLRISSAAEGEQAVRVALDFAARLSGVIGRSSPAGRSGPPTG